MPDEQINFNDVDLTNTDTSFPLLEPGMYKFSVVKVEAVENKKKTGDNIKIELKLEQTAKSTKGEEIQAGFPIFDTISMVKTEKYDPKRKLAQFQEVALGAKGPFAPLDRYLGKEVYAKIKVEDSEDYGEQNRVNLYVKPKVV